MSAAEKKPKAAAESAQDPPGPTIAEGAAISLSPQKTVLADPRVHRRLDYPAALGLDPLEVQDPASVVSEDDQDEKHS